MKKVMQYRKNIPSAGIVSAGEGVTINSTEDNPETVIAVSGKILQIGVQATPGTLIQFNNNQNSKIIIGATGVYELNLDNEFSIVNNLRIIYVKNNNDPFILDMIYEV